MLRAMDVVIALGGNLGDREGFLVAARRALEGTRGVALLDASEVYETAPLGPPQPHYLNAALLVRTDLGAVALLDRCLAIERDLGRVRAERWGARTIDLDLLWADQGEGARDPVRVSSASLTLPHPHLGERAFALAPLLDVRPDLLPRFGATLEHLGGRPALVTVKGWTSLLRRK